MIRLDTSRTPNDEKFCELLLFICQRSLGDERFGATKLNKLLFFADFLAFVKFGSAITWHSYQKLENGPAPRALKPLIEKLKVKGAVAQSEHNYYGRTQFRTIALRDADLASFTTDEIALVTEILEECWDKNASQMSIMSHRFMGWELAQEGEDIPYEVALLDFENPTSEDIECDALRVSELQKRAGECATPDADV